MKLKTWLTESFEPGFHKTGLFSGPENMGKSSLEVNRWDTWKLRDKNDCNDTDKLAWKIIKSCFSEDTFYYANDECLKWNFPNEKHWMFCVFPIEKNLQKLDITFTYQKLSSATL